MAKMRWLLCEIACEKCSKITALVEWATVGWSIFMSAIFLAKMS
jgi:23S rRNA C2498 (ribose-2'-O)-methylase RlmM